MLTVEAANKVVKLDNMKVYDEIQRFLDKKF